MIPAFQRLGGPPVRVEGGRLTAAPPPKPKAKPRKRAAPVKPASMVDGGAGRRRIHTVDGGDGETLLMSLSSLGRALSLAGPVPAFILATRRGWPMEHDGSKGVVRVPQTYLEARLSRPDRWRHSKRKSAPRIDLFTQATAKPAA